jgi:hypothetical protein
MTVQFSYSYEREIAAAEARGVQKNTGGRPVMI